ncbi:MAG: DUF4333 domain-containing protein [Leptolyngbyaceae cyanobacterium bins.349]|nr:DUF4333 domain-containing protein [Leptolyngbyaceae cyanobacterium bins.349]
MSQAQRGRHRLNANNRLNASRNVSSYDFHPIRSIRIVCLSLVTVGITGCGGLDNKKIANQIQQDITGNGGTSLKSVTCPGGINPEVGKGFECVGEMDNGYTFTITVQQQDEQGNLTWDVPHAKGLINVPKLESWMQENLTTEIGTKPTIACGGVYKAIKPGEGFECQLSYKVTKPVGRPTQATAKKPVKPLPTIEVTQTEKVNVTTDESGNVSWQRILPKVVATNSQATSRAKAAANQPTPTATSLD